MKVLFLCCLFVFSGFSVNAKEMSGVIVQESVQVDGTELQLNGAGIRSKFIFDIYIAELYLENPSSAADEVIAMPGRKRIVMHFLHDKVGKDKLVDAWNDGFKNNTEADVVVKLKDRIDQFNSMFTDVKKDDVVLLDFVPEKGTMVSIAGAEKGLIEGKDFNDALLKIWLGEKPVTKDLKKELLGLGD